MSTKLAAVNERGGLFLPLNEVDVFRGLSEVVTVVVV